MLKVVEYNSPVGTLLLGEECNSLILCDWRDGKHKLNYRLAAHPSPLIGEAVSKLNAYFEGNGTNLTLPLLYRGTPFQIKVWREICRIPYGMTLSYKELAERVGYTAAVRAVANAVGKNPISIFCPCHRVVGSNGTLTGYAGGLEAKSYLLELERKSLG